jgi:hypothetical protein
MWSGHSCPLPLTLNREEGTSGLARPFLLTEQQRQGMPHSFRVLCGKVGRQDSQVETTAQAARLRPDSRVHVNSQGCPVQARLGGDFSRRNLGKIPANSGLRRNFKGSAATVAAAGRPGSTAQASCAIQVASGIED